MELALWTYEGPPHVGAMRIATSMQDVHYVLHAPQGDTYADLLFTMIERRKQRPPVTYTTFQARDLGADTANLLIDTLRSAHERFQPAAMLVGESCTAELIQDQPGALAEGLGLPVPIVPLELPAYSKKENWGASETFYYLVRTLLTTAPAQSTTATMADSASSSAEHTGDMADAMAPDGTARRPRANLLGPTALGFRCRDNIIEITRLLDHCGIEVNVVAPFDASVADVRRIPQADFNICLYPEIARTTCQWLQRQFSQPYTQTVPIGVGATIDFLDELHTLCTAFPSVDTARARASVHSHLPWYSRSVDSNYLTGKRVYIFADGTHALAAARIARDELGFNVVGIGTYSRERAKEVRALASEYELTALISDDYLEVEQQIAELQPELVLGTQMERHIAKRLGIPCAVIATPVHVQDFPARFSPQMGFEGANVIFDTWVHPLVMGLEEHLLTMFRDDFEFNDHSAASHLGVGEHGAQPVSRVAAAETRGVAPARSDDGADVTTLERPVQTATATATGPEATALTETVLPGKAQADTTRWSEGAERELMKIPFFVRGKARRNTERYARERGEALITVDTLYDAKAHYAR